MVQFDPMTAPEHPSRAWPAWVWPTVLVVGLLDLIAGLEAHSWLDPAAERSPFSWASALTTLVAAVCVAILATRGRRNARIVLAVGLAFIAVDQAFGLHERLAADLDLRALVSLEWCTCALVGYTLLLGVVAVLLVLEIRASRRPPTMLLTGVALLVLALGARFGGAALAGLDALPAGETRDVGEAAMHACELMGWALVASGLLVLVRHRSA
jgi:hypothetical protein